MIFQTSRKPKFRHNLASYEKYQPKTSACWEGTKVTHVFKKSAFKTVQFLQSIHELQTYIYIHIQPALCLIVYIIPLLTSSEQRLEIMIVISVHNITILVSLETSINTW